MISKEEWKKKLDVYAQHKKIWMNEPVSVYDREADRYKEIMAFFELPVTGKLLDIGCGTCGIKKFIPSGLKYSGIDPLADMFKCEAIKGEAENLDFFDSRFDVVFILSTLDHCYDPQKALKEAHRILKKDGKLCVSNLIENKQNEHTITFTEDSLKKLIEQCSFKIIKAEFEKRKPNVLNIVAIKQELGFFEKFMNALKELKK